MLSIAAKVPRAPAPLPASSKVRGKVSFVCLGYGQKPKSPREGYAPSELQKKRWSSKALIEGWSPHLCGVQNGFYDDWKATRATQCKQSPIASFTRRTPCSDTHPLSCRRDAVRLKTKNLRCREKFVLDLTFDRRTNKPGFLARRFDSRRVKTERSGIFGRRSWYGRGAYGLGRVGKH
jgi:hypothetical protein